jgi:hypothetical protein
MRLYTRTGAAAVDGPDGHFDAGEDGAFDFPDEISSRLHGVAIGGVRQWETDVERQHRQIAEEIERRKDPATLLDAVQKLVTLANAMPAAAAEPAPAKVPAAKAASGKTPA